ncbi:N-alpha-acetyltransferase 80 [Parasteatoda tepidariorum]|uniref:N-alpha-acetyltransferase 80 n=1 Tax=Parasteatoda tepidariorum TaxID=114398 RepID=UPI00077F8E98|nr:N-alpha-acetyltransferase 80 [Parasteatoda tepidariorum]
MSESSLSVVYLHKNKEYIQECADLLNKQWERSSSARTQSLENTSSELPDSVILIEEINGVKCVIGHSRLTRVLEDNKGCWIGSVVIAKEKQRKGYGKYLMKKSEEYAKNLNFTTVYLNTQDQQGFYEHLGYQYSEAVSSISFKPNGLLMRGLFDSIKHQQPLLNEKNCEESCKKITKEIMLSECNEQQNCFAPPPPPPLPISKVNNKANIKSNLGHYWMKKSL